MPRTNSAAAPSSSVSAERSSRRGRLGLRALQVRERRVGRAALDRDRRRLAQPLDDPRVGARRREHQLRRDPLRAGAELGQQPRGAGVLEPAPGGGQLEVDGVADERVDEAERLVGAQDLGAHERLDRLRGASSRRSRRAPAIAGSPACSPSTATARATAAAGAGSRASRSSTVRETARGPIARTEAASGAGALLGGERGQQLAQQQRVAGGDVLAGGGERAVGVAEQRGHEAGRAVGGQRPRLHGDRRRVLADLAQQQLVGVRLAGADRRRDEHGQPRDAAASR